jgi:hypothetical protein
MKELNNKLLSKNKFSLEVEELRRESPELTYLECLLIVTDKFELEHDKIAKLISDSLKEKIKEESIQLKLIKNTGGAKLPL